MKSVLLCLPILLAFLSQAETIQVRWDFKHVKEGYDYDSRMYFYLDGDSVSCSDIFKLTAKGSANLDVPKGKHVLRVVNYVLYKGTWEMQSLANDYSLDAFASADLDPAQKNLLTLHFDITRNKIKVRTKRVQHPEIDRTVDYSFALDWKFENVQDGYDAPVVFWIYIDGRLACATHESPQSEGGKEMILLPEGKHEIRMEGFVKTKDGFEPYLVKTGYEFDAVVDFSSPKPEFGSLEAEGVQVVVVRFDVLGRIHTGYEPARR